MLLEYIRKYKHLYKVDTSEEEEMYKKAEEAERNNETTDISHMFWMDDDGQKNCENIE